MEDYILELSVDNEQTILSTIDNNFIVEVGTASIPGATGATGASGSNGKSAYEIAVSDGYVGTETQWLLSLRGSDGKSAYRSYVDTTTDSPVLTESEWTESLKIGDKITLTPTRTEGGFTKGVQVSSQTNTQMWNTLLCPYVAGSYSFFVTYNNPETGSVYSGTSVEKGYSIDIYSVTISNVADSNGSLMNNLYVSVYDPAVTEVSGVFSNPIDPVAGTSTILSQSNKSITYTTASSSNSFKIYAQGINADSSTFSNVLISSMRFYDIALFGTSSLLIDSSNCQSIFDSIRSSESNGYGKRICTTRTQQYSTTSAFNSDGNYGYIVYPSSMGSLSSIKQNNAEEQFSAWVNCGTFDYANPKGLITNMIVYRTSVPKAYASGQSLYCS